MKHISYTCDKCDKEIDYNSSKMIIDNEKIVIDNTLPNCKILSGTVAGPLHFCSKECFCNYFFKTEKEIKDAMNDLPF